MAQACWLARDLHIPLPSTALAAERSALTAWLHTDASTPAAGSDLAAASAWGVSLPEQLLSPLPDALAAAPARTMADAFDLYLAGDYLKDQHLINAARTAADALRTAGGAYRYSSQTGTPDLVSTAEASIICSATVRARAGPVHHPGQSGTHAALRRPAGNRPNGNHGLGHGRRRPGHRR